MLNAAESMHNLNGIYARFQRNPCTKPAVSIHGMGGIFKKEGMKELLAYLFSEEVQHPIIKDLNQGGFSLAVEIREVYPTEKHENPAVD